MVIMQVSLVIFITICVLFLSKNDLLKIAAIFCVNVYKYQHYFDVFEQEILLLCKKFNIFSSIFKIINNVPKVDRNKFFV